MPIGKVNGHGAEGALGVQRLRVGRDDEYAEIRLKGSKLADELQPARAGESEIDEREVRLGLAYADQRLGGIGSLAANGEAGGTGEEGCIALAHHRVILDEENPPGYGHGVRAGWGVVTGERMCAALAHGTAVAVPGSSESRHGPAVPQSRRCTSSSNRRRAPAPV